MSAIDSRVINIDELKLEHFEKGDKFESNAVRIGPLPEQQHRQGQFAFGQIGAQRLACRSFGAEQVHAIVVELVRGAKGKAELAQRLPRIEAGAA